MTMPGLSAKWVSWQLGGDGQPNGAGWFRCHCPGHDSGGLALALRDGVHGLLVKCFGGCIRPVILNAITSFLMSGQFRSETPPLSGVPIRQEEEEQATVNLASAQRLWAGSSKIAGSPAEQHLRDRGITVVLPGTLQFHPSVWRADRRSGAPALLGLVTDVHDDPQAVHRIWLPSSLPKLKLSLGSTSGSAVRLTEATDTVAITEGIETGLSLMQLTGIPTWAALSTSGMRGIALPERIRTVVIGADADLNGAGLAAANALRDRLLGEGRTVRVILPPPGNKDFNDMLRGAR
jgi:hypothetical protein